MEIFRQLIQSGSHALKGWMEFGVKNISNIGEVITHYIDELVDGGQIRKEESHRAIDMITDFLEKNIQSTEQKKEKVDSVESKIEILEEKIKNMEETLTKKPRKKKPSTLKNK